MSRRQVGHLEGATFGERLRAARKSAAVTQEGLARHVNVTLRTAQRWEVEGSGPRGDQLVAIGELLGIDPLELYPEREAA